MGTVELRSNIHKMVDNIQNEQLLKSVFEFLKSREGSNSANLWDDLTEAQKQEVYLAFEESENEEK